MCKANDYIKQLTEIYSNIKKDCDELELAIYKENAKKQDWEHFIESQDIDNIDGLQALYHIKRFKEIRDNRRTYKNEFETLKQLKKNFVDKNVGDLLSLAKSIESMDNTLHHLTENKIYHNRIDSNGDISCHSGNTRAMSLQRSMSQSESDKVVVTKEALGKFGISRKGKEKIQVIGIEGKHYRVKIFRNNGGISEELFKPSSIIFD